jgi:hypothetical protein
MTEPIHRALIIKKGGVVRLVDMTEREGLLILSYASSKMFHTGDTRTIILQDVKVSQPRTTTKQEEKALLWNSIGLHEVNGRMVAPTVCFEIEPLDSPRFVMVPLKDSSILQLYISVSKTFPQLGNIKKLGLSPEVVHTAVGQVTGSFDALLRDDPNNIELKYLMLDLAGEHATPNYAASSHGVAMYCIIIAAIVASALSAYASAEGHHISQMIPEAIQSIDLLIRSNCLELYAAVLSAYHFVVANLYGGLDILQYRVGELVTISIDIMMASVYFAASFTTTAVDASQAAAGAALEYVLHTMASLLAKITTN